MRWKVIFVVFLWDGGSPADLGWWLGAWREGRDWETLNLNTTVDTVVARLGVGLEKRWS